jgi:hypothetical protein
MTLLKEKTSLPRPRKVVKFAQILHSNLLLERGDNPLEQMWIRGSQNNVVNVEEEVGNPINMVIYEQRSVGLGLNKPQCQQESGKPRAPCPRSLLQTI